MTSRISASRVEHVPPTATVTDYDQLEETQQTAVRRLAAGESVDGVDLPEVVRFTGYYRIERETASSSRSSAISD